MPEGTQPSPPPSPLQVIVAAAVAVIFLGMSVWLLSEFGKDWSHAVVIYNTVCSIAFTAFGVLLGSKVQEVNVAKATASATEAKADAAKKAVAIKSALTTLRPGIGANDEAGGGASAVESSRYAHEILLRALE